MAVLKPQINRKSLKNTKGQPTESQKNAKSKVQVKWGPGFCI